MNRNGATLTWQDPAPFEMEAISGLMVNVSGELEGFPVYGQALLISGHADLDVFLIGLTAEDGGQNFWQKQVQPEFETVAKSLNWSEETSNTCSISTDPTYGYSEENPVRVGGEFFNGPSRERSFLDNLRGPNGETLSYQRTGSILSGNTILDVYVLNGLSKPITLYIDMYVYEAPQAPLGLTCAGPFPLTAP